jgi:hypothetical protein
MLLDLLYIYKQKQNLTHPSLLILPHLIAVAGLILGGYTTLFMLVKIWPSSKKEVEAAPVAKAAADTGTIPSVEDEAFAEFIENEENLQKWIDSAE